MPIPDAELEGFSISGDSGPVMKEWIILKASIGLFSQKLQSVHSNVLRQCLGSDFEKIVQFFEAVEQQLVPLVLQATSDVIMNSTNEEADLWNVHRQGNNNFRLIDYQRTSSSPRQGDREHRDPSTATIIFQDGSVELEVQDPSIGEWRAVPSHETVIMWGRCGQVFSGGRVKAVNNRVI